MVKRYTVLQKKLEELESELNQVFVLPAETPCHQLLSVAIGQKLAFFNNLLAAEAKSHPRKPHHLDHIAQRLQELEAVFNDWDNFRTSPSNHLDTASTCSCTESCLNDDGGDSLDSGSPIHEDLESIREGMTMDEKLTGETVKAEPEGDMKREEGRGGVWKGKNGVVTAGVLMFAVVLMGWFANGCYYKKGQGQMEAFLTPT